MDLSLLRAYPALSHVATYLSKTTRAIFASALTAPSLSWSRTCGLGDNITLSEQAQIVMACPPNKGKCKCISSYSCECMPERYKRLHEYYDAKGIYDLEDGSWDVLNFIDVEHSVRLKLTDGSLMQ